MRIQDGGDFHESFTFWSIPGMTTFGLSSIGQIALKVRDAARAAEFYRDKLGVPLLLEASKTAFFDCGGVKLTLGPAEGSVLYFKVDDIEAAAETLKSRGVSFDRDPHLVARMPDHELWMALFRDPDGNTLALMSEKKMSEKKR
jgi:methylmalonyl-CoA/ethylmalonyl-CoA epimerase